MADLKPCPFCGRIPVVEDCGENRYFVRCKCGIAQDKLYAQRCDAVRRWNKRKELRVKDTNAPITDTISRQADIDPCEMCQYNSLDWHEEPCESCTDADNHWKPSAQPTQTNTFKALEALDCISRAAAIEVADAIWSVTGDKNVAKVWDQLKDLPSAQPMQWIPCSERLPKGRELVNVSCHDDSGDTSYDYSSCGWVTDDGEYWIVDNEINNFVVAWMPLPKSWKGEQDALN